MSNRKYNYNQEQPLKRLNIIKRPKDTYNKMSIDDIGRHEDSKKIQQLQQEINIMSSEFYELKDEHDALKRKNDEDDKKYQSKHNLHQQLTRDYNEELRKNKNLVEANKDLTKINNKIISTFKLVEKYDKEICSICRELPGKKVVTNCGHVFHKDCLQKSMERSINCPLCRTRIESSLFCFDTKCVKYEHKLLTNEILRVPRHSEQYEYDSSSDFSD